MTGHVLVLVAGLGVLALGAGVAIRLRARNRPGGCERVSDLPSRRAFAYQLGLILFPVVLLATVAMVALWRDRAAVDEEIRARARTIAEDLANRLGTRLPVAMKEWEVASVAWEKEGGVGAEESILTQGGESSSISSMSDRSPWTEFPLKLDFNPDGTPDRRTASVFGLQPPGWLVDMTREQRGAWDQYCAAMLVATNASLSPELSQQVPVAELAFRQEFARLRDDRNHRPVGERVQGLLILAQKAAQQGWQADSGVPLAAMIFAEACRLSPAARWEGEWTKALPLILSRQPSVADGWLLTQGKLMAERSDNPLLIKGMERLRRRSLAIRQAAELSSALSSPKGLLPSEPQAPFWLPWGSNYWLIAIDRSGADSDASHSNAANSGVFSVRAFPADTLGRVVIQALTGPAAGGAVSFSEAPRMPDGLKAEVALSGHPLRMGGTPWLAHDLERNTPLLAEFELPVGPPLKGQLAVRIHLVDKSAIYAQQRQREWLMGAMILLTAGVAGVGARQAHRAYQRQWALNEQKSNFVSSVSHELRAPLASMRLLAEGLVNGRVHEDAKRQEYAGFLLQETRRLGSLVENVLDFARIEQGRKLYDFEPTDVVRLVAETIRLMEPLATEQQVSITGPSWVVTSPERESVVGNWDGAAVQRALLNLLDNALKHAPPGSRIEVSIVPDLKVRAVSLRVKDQGPGIPASEHERIFERFYRRGSELRRETKGVGLGLTIVRHIMEAHGGQVRVSSEVGQGAEFILELPLSAKEVNE